MENAPFGASMKRLRQKLAKYQDRLSQGWFWRDHLAEAQAELARLRRELPSQEMMLTIPFLFHGKGYYRTMKLKQNMEELRGFVTELTKMPLKRVCEVGTYKGGTLFIWCQLAEPDARVISVDLPGGQFGGGYSEKSLPFFQSFRKPGQTLDCIRGSSHDEAIRAQFKEALGDERLDFLFLDGDHRYDGVKRDYEYYSEFVRPGGVIGFHDIYFREKQPEIEVHKFWNELKSKHRHLEFIESGEERRKIGLGLLYKD